MGPRGPSRDEIIEWLGRAGEQAQHVEAYHAVAADPGALEGRAAHQAACDAGAMQLIELAGCAEGFIRNRGDAGTTLARLDNALRPLVELRDAHTHPEMVDAPPPITPRRLGELIGQLRTAIRNLDSETRKYEPPGQVQALQRISVGLQRIEGDGVPDPRALRPRDLKYAGYYREIRFGRLAKATGLFDNWDKSFRHGDARHVAINASISAVDNMAHKFHVMRDGVDKSVLPASITGSEHGNRGPGRSLSGLMREVRDEYLTPGERLREAEIAEAARDRQQYRDAVRGFAHDYARMTGDPKAAALIHDYVQYRSPPLDRESIDEMREALRVASGAGGDYLALPEAACNRCLELCFALEKQGDRRLIDILDAAERRGVAGGPETIYDRYPGLTRDEGVDRARGKDLEVDLDFDEERGPRRRR